MSTDTPVVPGVGTPAAAAPEPPKTAIQIIEQDLINFYKQKEQAIANVHAIDGAIQSTQMLLGKLKAEVLKGEAWAKAEAEKVIAAVEAEAKKL
jgi:hypothetical protein